MGVLGGAEAFPRHGRLGAGAIALAALAGRFDGAEASSLAAILAWWGLALALDGAAQWRRGASVLEAAPDAFVWMAVLSIFLGVGLEWTAGRLGAWAYLGLPPNELARYAVQGAVFAPFLPALYGAAGLLGAEAGLDAPARQVPNWAAWVGLLSGLALALGPLQFPEAIPGLPAMGCAFAGLCLFCDSINALRGRPNLFQRKVRTLIVWVAAGLALVAAGALIGVLSGQGRFPAGFESPALHDYLLLAALGPAMRASCLCLADTLGVPAWPARENLSALIR